MSNQSIPSTAKPILTMAFATGKTNQQTFSELRSKGHSVTYQQVVAYRVQQESQFNSSFESIFRS